MDQCNPRECDWSVPDLRAFLGGMLVAGWGRIINFSSAASLHPPGPLNSAYGTSKVALNQFTRHLASELVGTGVTANVIHPGEVKTAMWASIKSESANADGAESFRQWAAGVGDQGGDDPERTLELIQEIIDGSMADIRPISVDRRWPPATDSELELRAANPSNSSYARGIACLLVANVKKWILLRTSNLLTLIVIHEFTPCEV